MPFNLDPSNSADNPVYEQIRTLLDVDTTNAAIDADPIFQLAKQEIEARLEIDNENRAQARLALVFCYAADALEGGGKSTVSSETESGGDLKSITIGEVSKTFTESRTRARGGAETDPSARADFFRSKCEEILKTLGATETESDVFATVLLTDSRL